MNKALFVLSLVVCGASCMYVSSMEHVSDQLAHMALQPDYNRPLFDAIKANNINDVEKAIEAGADINAALDTQDYRTPLGQALYEYQNRTNNVGIIQLLLGHGADPNIYRKKDEKYESMLRRLYRPEDRLWFRYPVASLLAEHGADFEKHDTDFKNQIQLVPIMEPIFNFLFFMRTSSRLNAEWEADQCKVLLLTTDLLHAARFKKITDKLSSTEYGAATLNPNDMATIKNGIAKRKDELGQLSEEIKEELAQKEMNYVNATLVSMGSEKNKSIINTLTASQLDGKMQYMTGQLKYRHNTVTYGGKAYLVSRMPLQIKK